MTGVRDFEQRKQNKWRSKRQVLFAGAVIGLRVMMVKGGLLKKTFCYQQPRHDDVALTVRYDIYGKL